LKQGLEEALELCGRIMTVAKLAKQSSLQFGCSPRALKFSQGKKGDAIRSLTLPPTPLALHLYKTPNRVRRFFRSYTNRICYNYFMPLAVIAVPIFENRDDDRCPFSPDSSVELCVRGRIQRV